MSPLPIEFHPEARTDALEAYHWYAKRSERAAEAFRESIKAAGESIRQSPERWASYLHGTRRYLLKRFPFVIVYRLTKHRIEIIAVAHGRRKPGFWKVRLDSE
jgi:plasmid stabilization system protein ParE